MKAYNKVTEWCEPILNPLGLTSIMAAATLLPVALASKYTGDCIDCCTSGY